MGLAVISANTTIKISTGGSFNITATATPVTTAANEYAKVKISGSIFQFTNGSGNSLSLTVAGNVIKSLGTSNSGDEVSFSNDGHFLDVFVPPNSSLIVTKSGSASTALVTGTYQKFINSP